MLSVSPRALADAVGAAGAHVGGDFIADENTRFDILALSRPGEHANLLDHLRGKTVLLALPGQLAAAVALIQLDGVARRIILWPHDGLQGHLGAVMKNAGVDVAVTTWPVPLAGTHDALSWLSHAPAVRGGRHSTEWVLFTSGTTGVPKMVVHTLESLAGHLAPRPAGTDAPVWCTFYDIRRYGGLQILLRALVGGGSLVLSSAHEAPGAFLARAAACGATHFLGTPSHWRRALMTDEHLLIAPRYVRLSGEVADQMILDRLREAYPQAELVHAFASTEAGLAFEVKDGRAGFPASLVDSNPTARVRVKDGALQVRSARNAAGILNGAVAGIVDGDGYVDTGDVVVLRDGRYHFAGRRDGVVNVGGQKVHPEEVEAVINQHPDVEMSLVRSRANPITGAIVVAEIVRKGPGLGQSRALEEDVRAFCRSRLEPHKVPASIRLVASLDIAPTGKLVRLGA